MSFHTHPSEMLTPQILTFAKASTLFPKGIGDGEISKFALKHLYEYKALYDYFREIRKQISFLSSKGASVGISYRNEETLSFSTGEKVSTVLKEVREKRGVYFLTEFGLVKPRELDGSTGLPIAYRRRDWTEELGFQVEMVSTHKSAGVWEDFVTHHTYLRLIDPYGNVSTVGKFAKEILWVYGSYMKQASQLITSPDICECKYPGENQTVVSVSMTQDNFNEMKADIVHDIEEQSRGKIHGDFNYSENNCAVWCWRKMQKFTDIPKIDGNLTLLRTTVLESLLSKYMDERLSRAINKISSAIVVTGVFFLFYKIISSTIQKRLIYNITHPTVLSSILCFAGLFWVAKIYFVVSQGGLTKNPLNKNSLPLVNTFYKLVQPSLTTFISPRKVVLLLKYLLKQQELQRKKSQHKGTV